MEVGDERMQQIDSEAVERSEFHQSLFCRKRA